MYSFRLHKRSSYFLHTDLNKQNQNAFRKIRRLWQNFWNISAKQMDVFSDIRKASVIFHQIFCQKNCCFFSKVSKITESYVKRIFNKKVGLFLPNFQSGCWWGWKKSWSSFASAVPKSNPKRKVCSIYAFSFYLSLMLVPSLDSSTVS